MIYINYYKIMTTIQSSLFDNFGKISYNVISPNNINFISNIIYEEDKFKFLEQICKNILCCY